MKRIVISIVFSFASFGLYADGCDGILSLTRTIDYEKKSIRIASELHSEYCEGSSLRSGKNFNVGLEATIKAIPIGLQIGSGSTREQMQHLCSSYKSWFDSNSESVALAISTSDRAIDAWRDCKLRKEDGVFYTVNPQKELVGFGVRRGSSVIDFLGMDYDSDHLTCFGPFGENGKEVVIDKETRSPLTEDSDYPITCRRKMVTATDGTEHLPATEVSIEAQGAPSLIVPLPREEKYEPTYSSQISEQFVQLNNEIAVLGNTLNGRVDNSVARSDAADAAITSRVANFVNGLKFQHYSIQYGESYKYNANATHFVGCGNMDAKATELCSAAGGSIVYQAERFLHSGDKCGYSLKDFVCAIKPF